MVGIELAIDRGDVLVHYPLPAAVETAIRAEASVGSQPLVAAHATIRSQCLIGADSSVAADSPVGTNLSAGSTGARCEVGPVDGASPGIRTGRTACAFRRTTDAGPILNAATVERNSLRRLGT